MSGSKRMAIAMCAALVVYLVFVVWRGVQLIEVGGQPMLLGFAVLALPFIGFWSMSAEWRFGRATERLGKELAERGALPVDDLPRMPSGRPQREAADARFAEVRAKVDADPDSWERWFELSVAYDDAGDRRLARSAMRHAIELHDRASA